MNEEALFRMAINVTQRAVGSVMVLIIKGKLDVGNFNNVSDAVNSLILSGHKKYIFECSELKKMDDASAMQMLRLSYTIKVQNGQLIVVGLKKVDPRVSSKVLMVVASSETEREALMSL
jgi:anti-anti-sigma regulatory factor